MAQTDYLFDVVYPLLEDLDTPRSLSVYLLIGAAEWEQLVNLSCSPLDYLTADGYRADAIATDLLRKCENLPWSDPLREKKTFAKWLDAEKQCFLTNRRLDRFLHNHQLVPEDAPLFEFLECARLYVRDTLGKLPDAIEPALGPGTTFTNRQDRSTVLDKFTSESALTADTWPFLSDWAQTAWGRSRLIDPIVVRGNRLGFVPKTALIKRPIGVEPGINVFYQKAYGRLLKQRLKRSGLDIPTLQPKHRQLAREASVSEHLATIDLSSASDTVSRVLVEFLLPADWFFALDSLRSTHTLIPKGFISSSERWVRLEKFSSMGNCFTFELETLIFSALVHSVLKLTGRPHEAGVDYSIYGDDILVETSSAPLVVKALNFSGFTTNNRKTFVSGPFRESCGGDFFSGVDVRPHYLEELPHEPMQYIAMANALYRLGHSDSSDFWNDTRFLRAWLRAIGWVPSDLRCLRGPTAGGDIFIHDRSNTWTVRKKDGVARIKAVVPVSPPISLDRWGSPDIVMAAALYGVSSEGVTRRGVVTGHKVKWIEGIAEFFG